MVYPVKQAQNSASGNPELLSDFFRRQFVAIAHVQRSQYPFVRPKSWRSLCHHTTPAKKRGPPRAARASGFSVNCCAKHLSADGVTAERRNAHNREVGAFNARNRAPDTAEYAASQPPLAPVRFSSTLDFFPENDLK